MDKTTHDKGLAIRTKRCSARPTSRLQLKNADDFNKPFQELVTEYCWGAGVGSRGIAAARRAACSTWR